MRRRAAVAGTWYPDDPQELTAEIDRYLSPGSAPPSLDPVLAVLAPHAGIMYSGHVAGHAYRALARASRPDVVVLVGPSHYVAFDGVAVWPDGSFDTPLGSLPVDREVAAALLADRALAQDLPSAHAREHSLEMQLPFLARVFPGTRIVPIVMGYQERETIVRLADALVQACRGRRVALVASSDLSHFFDASTANTLDARVAALVGDFDAPGLLSELERYPEGERGRFVMCGGGPAVSVMMAAHGLGARHAAVLKHSHSGEVSGDDGRVVGYLAAAFGGSSADTPE